MGVVAVDELVHGWDLARATGQSFTCDPASTAAVLELARSRGDRLSTYVALYNLGQTAIAAGDHRQARRYLDEGIRLSEQTQDMANMAYFLDSLAVVEAADAAPGRIAVLLGAAQSLREEVGANVYGYYLPDESLLNAVVAATREAMGSDAYDDAVDQGRALDTHGAARFALLEPQSAT